MRHLVLIPHLPSAQQGHELILAVTGWKRHFKVDFTLAVMGEGLPDIQGVVNVESKRVPYVPGEYRSHLDYVSCARKAREMFPETKGFFVAADDVFAVNDFGVDDILTPKIQDVRIPTDGDNAWRRNLAKTGLALQADGYPALNWTTHLPHYYEWDKLFAVYDKYDCDHNSYVIENLYYNIYPPYRRPETLYRGDRYKFEVSCQPLDRQGLANAFARKIWVTCTEHGWSKQMEEALANHYGITI